MNSPAQATATLYWTFDPAGGQVRSDFTRSASAGQPAAM
jgi:hypothetical protein